jgi:hypothetical protein
MNNIPKKLRGQMGSEEYYKICAITGLRGTFNDPVQWHHNYILAGKQLQKRFAIIPIRKSVHERVSNFEIKEKLDWIMLNRATDAEVLSISLTFDYFRCRHQLNQKYGVYVEPENTNTGINYPWLEPTV